MVSADRSAERAKQDYVKAIYQLGGNAPVRGVDLARYLAVSRAAVTKSRRVLEKARLVTQAATRTDRIELTGRGRALAVRMLRRHRLIETFLHRCLNVPLVELHARAEAIEHVISDDIAARLGRFLGNPQVDPHGHPISMKRGMIPSANARLADAPKGSRVRIESIPDRDPSAVRQLVERGVLPGLTATVIDRDGRRLKLRSTRGVAAVAVGLASKIAVRIQTRKARSR